MGLVYIEYISRRPEAPVAEFHRVVTAGQEGWDDAHGEDQLVLNLGRTWRLGPEPEYLGVWYTPAAGVGRLDDWDRIFRGGAADHLERPFHEVARIDVAGCYEPLVEPVRARGSSPYYAEFFRDDGDPEAVRRLYDERARRNPRCRLTLLVRRIGRLAPDPGGLAVWTLPDFAALEGLARELDGLERPVALVAAATYADLGREIL